MKKLKILLIAVLFPVFVFSQGVEIVPFTGWMFGGSVKYIQGKLDIKDGVDYGVSLLVPVSTYIDFELNYTRMESIATFSPYSGYPGYEHQQGNIATNYIHVGGLSKFAASEKVAPFGSFSLGATWFESESYGDYWSFSVALGLGVKIMLGDRIGIIGRGRLLMPLHFSGIGFWAGSGGSGLTVNSYVYPLQGDFNIGLIIKLGG